MAFHKKIKQLREYYGLNQEQLGKIIGVSYSTISNYEQGVRQPDQEKLIKLADYFGVTIDYLLRDTSNTITIDTGEPGAENSPAGKIRVQVDLDKIGIEEAIEKFREEIYRAVENKGLSIDVAENYVKLFTDNIKLAYRKSLEK